MNFKELFLQGKVKFEDILDFIDTWHESNTSVNLSDFLGLTNKEMHLFAKGDSSLKKELEKIKKGYRYE